MKNFITFLLFFPSLVIYAQFQDNFQYSLEDTERPVKWSGDLTEFIINDDFMLQLNSSVEQSPVQLRTPSVRTKNTCWEFFVQMDFAPSSSNYTRIYLASDAEDLCGELNGFFIRIGHLDKNISLVQSQTGKNNKVLIKGESKRLDHSIIRLHIKAILDHSGKFFLYSKLNEEEAFSLEGTYQADNIPGSDWLGIVCTFTTTRSKLFYFDNFSVKIQDEDAVVEPEPEVNPLEYGDILFSEIMAHPNDNEPEYIELYNNSKEELNLRNLLFFYGDKSYSLPDKIIPSGSYFVLCKNNAIDFFDKELYIIGVNNFPTLANSGKLLMITNLSGKLIAWCEYSDKMYNDENKKKGGWALECKDLSNLSNLADNWTSSVHENGGTPGKENSVKCAYPDTQPLFITGASPANSHEIQISFSKPMHQLTLLDKNSYSINNGDYQISRLTSNYPRCTELFLELNKYPENGEWIHLFVPGLKDLSGNEFAEDFFIPLGYNCETQANDIALNEILFNPDPDCNEYVEIVNRSGKTLDLRFLSITSRKPSDGSFNKIYPLSLVPSSLEPDEYLVITQSKDLVCNSYTCFENALFTELENMPSMANTSGCIVILNNLTHEVIDEFYYSESMHSSSVKNKKGVALERINMDNPTNDPENWTSASNHYGYGTPGYTNSQQFTSITEKDTKREFTLEYPGPGNDAYQIHYILDYAGYNSKVILFDISGRRMDDILNNEILGTQGSILWNKKSDLSAGIYIIYIEIFNATGNIHSFKLPVVLN